MGKVTIISFHKLNTKSGQSVIATVKYLRTYGVVYRGVGVCVVADLMIHTCSLLSKDAGFQHTLQHLLHFLT